jgi:lipoprotein signal peptidase
VAPAAGPDSGPRRASAPLILALAVVLLAAAPLPIFVLAPLAGLLAASRPRSFRAAGWLGVSLAGVVVWSLQAQGLLDEAITAWAILVSGAFVCLALVRPMSLLRRASLALVLGTLAAGALGIVYDVSWRGLEVMAARDMAAGFADKARQLDEQGDGYAAAVELFRLLESQSRAMAAMLPATYVLGMLGALAMAWRWHEVIADEPLEPASRPFAEFRFADHWIWVLIGALALALVGPVTGPVAALATNVLLVVLALYGARGLAILRQVLAGMSPPLVVLLGLVGLVLLIFTLSGLLVLGVADTWLDLRRMASDPNSRKDR